MRDQTLRELPDVRGPIYQPCLADVGTRICVHALPAQEEDKYEGMPMFAEVGPL